MEEFAKFLKDYPQFASVMNVFIGAFFAMVGCFFVAWRNRVLEVTKLRINRREETLNFALEILNKCYLYIPVIKKDDGLIELEHLEKDPKEQKAALIELSTIGSSIELYGLKKEIEYWKNAVEKIKKYTDLHAPMGLINTFAYAEMNNAVNEFRNHVLKNYRKELGIKD